MIHFVWTPSLFSFGRLDSNIGSKWVVSYYVYVFTMDFDHPLKKGNQVIPAGNSSVLDEISKNQDNKLWKPHLKRNGRINEQVSKLGKKWPQMLSKCHIIQMIDFDKGINYDCDAEKPKASMCDFLDLF